MSPKNTVRSAGGVARRNGCYLGAVPGFPRGSEMAASEETGRFFSDIKRARSMLLHALPDLFHCLDDPHISTTTNGLEGYFSRLKSHYRQHRGLRPHRRPNYFAWYFHFVPR